MNNIISNCPLCGEHSLHVLGSTEETIQQCINCGMMTMTKFKMVDGDDKAYDDLSSDMKNWAVLKNGHWWLPTLLTLPSGMLFPENDEEGVMHWSFAPMVDIPEEEQKNYPTDDGKSFHTRKVDTDNKIIYDNFLEAMTVINSDIKKDKPVEKDFNLPKLKKL